MLNAADATRWYRVREATFSETTTPGASKKTLTLTMPGSWSSFSASLEVPITDSNDDHIARLVELMIARLGPYKDVRFALGQAD